MIAHAFDLLDSIIAARREQGHLLVGLDFDGTLTPIMPRPEDALLPDDVRAVLRALTRRTDTSVAVLSGRGLADIACRIGLSDVYYAGNHGLEIEGPDVHRAHPQAEAVLPLMGEIARDLTDALATLDGAQLEDKGLTLSVHYRRATDEATERAVLDIVDTLCAPHANLVVTHGKKVVEVRPAVDWDKGKALRFLRGSIRSHESAPTVFIGDDRTDEDAFLEVGTPGHGIIVADPPPAATHAHAFLRSPPEVTTFLQRLAGT